MGVMRTADQAAAEIESRTKPAAHKAPVEGKPEPTSKRLKTAKTVVTEHEEQEISLNAIELLPELLQVRAVLDKKWCKQYAEDRANGATFPPIIIFRLPDGRLVVTDGYHRVDAWKAIGLKTIRAQIRDGTIQQALLAAIEANTAEFHRGRPFNDDDRRHAVEMLLADQSWGWPDLRIANYCGVYPRVVQKIRNEYSIKHNIELPEKVIDADGKTRPYKNSSSTGKPSVSSSKGRSGFRVHIGGSEHYLSGTKDEAVFKAQSIYNDIQENKERRRRSLDRSTFQSFLTANGISFRSMKSIAIKVPSIDGLKIGHTILTVCDLQDKRDIPWAFGCLHALRILAEDPAARLVVVCYPEEGPQASIELYRKLGIEFLTPDELVASLKGSEADGPGEPIAN